jgi:hypothetical protein
MPPLVGSARVQTVTDLYPNLNSKGWLYFVDYSNTATEPSQSNLKSQSLDQAVKVPAVHAEGTGSGGEVVVVLGERGGDALALVRTGRFAKCSSVLGSRGERPPTKRRERRRDASYGERWMRRSTQSA